MSTARAGGKYGVLSLKILVGGGYEEIHLSSGNWRPFLLFGTFPPPVFLRFVLADDPEEGCKIKSKWLREQEHETKAVS
jgi:hypothetical protein